MQQHIANLRTVFLKLQDAGLRLNFSKCEFFQERVCYLGHVIDRFGLHKDEGKIAAIVNAPQPENTTQVKAFIGLVNYYSKFFPNMSQVMAPIYNLLQKNRKFDWNKGCAKAFEHAKEIISSDQVLAHFSRKLPIKLVCDGSQYGIGAAMFHITESGEEKPVCFVSRTLTKAEQNYSVIDREALAIYYGVKKLSHYLIGRHFTLQTDHRPLVSIFGPKQGIPVMAASRLQRWAVYLSSFDFEIQYIVGKTNYNADFLSRLPTGDKMSTASSTNNKTYLNFIDAREQTTISSKEIVKATAQDSTLQRVHDFVKNGWQSDNIEAELKPFYSRNSELTIESGAVKWGHRVIVPKCLQQRILNELHLTHEGMSKMKARARAHFWWPKLDDQIEGISSNCEQCIQQRPEQKKVPFSSWPESIYPFQRLHIDFLGPFQGKQFFLIVDTFSKWVEVATMKSITSRETIENLRQFMARFGIPETIVSDNGRQFVSEEFQKFCKQNAIKHITSAPYKPQSNGAAERAVKTFKGGIAKAINDEKNRKYSMDSVISRFLFTYRSSIHRSTGETPYKRAFGREMKTHFDKLKPSKHPVSENPPTAKTFEIGDAVRVRDYRQKNHHWEAAKITKKIGSRLYECETEAGRWRRHVDQIMPAVNMNTKKHISNRSRPISKSMSTIISNDYSTPELTTPAEDQNVPEPMAVIPEVKQQTDDIAVVNADTIHSSQKPSTSAEPPTVVQELEKAKQRGKEVVIISDTESETDDPEGEALNETIRPITPNNEEDDEYFSTSESESSQADKQKTKRPARIRKAIERLSYK